jgi:hypothetical protein
MFHRIALPWDNESMATPTTCRAAEREARLAILSVAEAEQCSDETRKPALLRLAALIDGCMLEIEARRPIAPRHEPPFEPVYL